MQSKKQKNMNNNTLQKIIKKSKKLTNIIPHNHQWHFSFLVKKNKILSFSWNMPRKTSPLSYKFDPEYPYLHSEASLIKNFHPKWIDECIMVNTRIGKKGKIRLSKPCKYCQEMIKYFKIKDVYYTTDEGSFEKL